MNKLTNESSPYLLQHKDNPVEWFPWGDEAIENAKSNQKPILLSIGYSSCHWCHVMAHESFEDLETAELMNELFINIKVDREEHPELDEIYLQAVQMMSGHGGWPLTVFLTPELKPFFGGTYFPLEASYGQPTFKDVLVSVANFYKKNSEDVSVKSEQIHAYLKNFSHETSQIKLEEFLQDKNLTLDKIAQTLLKNYDDLLKILETDMDKIHGGFGHAPKFPQPSKLSAFLFSENKEHSKHAVFSLIQICCGGITDQIGGGISRYSVDAKWLVPHFEKMLYDNAQIIPLLAAASLISKSPDESQLLKDSAYETSQYLERDLKSLNTGLYYSSEDADSEGEEGLFYTFYHEEFSEIFSTDSNLLEFAERYYKVTVSGNFEGTNILTAPNNFKLFCENADISMEEGLKLKETVKKKLFAYRNKRIRPGLDNKCILSWNALLAKGFLQSSIYLNDRSLFQQGLKLIQSLLSNFKIENKYYHCLSKEKPKIIALADDVAFLLEACCEAFLLTGCADLLQEIKNLAQYLYHNFCDPKLGLLYYCEEGKNLIHRPVKNEDNVIYSANAAIIDSFIKVNRVLKMHSNNPYFSPNEFKLFEDLALITISNSAILANKIPISSAQILQKIKWLEKEKILLINNKQEQTDFELISATMQEFYAKKQGSLFISCSMNNKFALSELSNYSSKVTNNHAEYLYCDKTGCQLPVKNISKLF